MSGPLAAYADTPANSKSPLQRVEPELVDLPCFGGLMGLLRAGDPRGDVATMWEAKEAVRELYTHANR
jgi:hypothetical protein